MMTNLGSLRLGCWRVRGATTRLLKCYHEPFRVIPTIPIPVDRRPGIAHRLLRIHVREAGVNDFIRRFRNKFI
jgi:hypothetical protein